MNVELTIQEMFDNFLGLFKERDDCLNHLFCTIGNGYQWLNGELVLCSCEELSNEEIKILSSRLVDGKAYQHNKLSLRAESQLYENERIANGWYEDYQRKYPDEDIEHLKKVRQNTINKLPDDIYYKYPRFKRWGFYVNIPGKEHVDFSVKYAYLFNYPDNIKPDWKTAIEECKSLLIEDGFCLPERR